METKDQLKEIADKERLTAADKQFIVDLSELLGVEFTPKNKCANCYKDQAVVLYRELTKNEGTDGRRHLVKQGVDVIFKGERVNESATDDDLERLLAAGFPKQLMRRIAGTDGVWW